MVDETGDGCPRRDVARAGERSTCELRGDIFTQSTDCNILLLRLPRPVADRLAQTTFFYYWNEAEDEIRLVTSWDTTDEDIDAVIKALRNEE